MTSRDFCFWLQGVFEVNDLKSLDEKQTKIVKAHLALAFIHDIDPSMGDKEHQDKLNETHNSHLFNGDVKMRC
mgnify:CR=1 FL=1